MLSLAACAESAGMDLADAAVDERGLQNFVLTDHRHGLVARFPRSTAGCARIEDAAARLDVLRGHGLPVPRVLGMRVAGGPGRAHLRLSLVPGVPLDEVDTDRLPDAARQRLVDDLVALVDQISRFPVGRWPGPATPWAGLWEDLLEAVLRDEESTSSEVRRCQRAVQAARAAEVGLFHGDLGGVNCRVDPSTGAVTGVLDWDSATIGDTATDRVAVLHGVGPATAAQLRASSPRWAESERAYQAYVDTWPIQARLWRGRRHPLGHSSPASSTSATTRRTVSDE